LLEEKGIGEARWPDSTLEVRRWTFGSWNIIAAGGPFRSHCLRGFGTIPIKRKGRIGPGPPPFSFTFA
jgi:hypothetical protein